MREEEGLRKKEKEKKSKQKCREEQKHYKKGEERSQVDCLVSQKCLMRWSKFFTTTREQMRTWSTYMANGKAKLCQPPTRTSPRLAALRSNTAVQIPTPTPDVPVKETVTLTLSPKKRQNFRMAGESFSIRDTRTPLQKEDTDLEQDEAVPVAEVGGGVDLPKNDVYDALWAMLDAESEAEEIPGEWDMDNVLQNWGRNEPDVGPAGPDQGPPPAEI
ncbi:hypothetical protein PIB30_027531 [Stylosanthes scabra]|uniref:Uncharacterized protein n=1 Tax=Stylosanthes scabra TaxID=79078 RepID=A0ABU6TCQ8_9FABA|nr:hypothetical protein [Stylosanthes scabra]